MSMLAGWTKWCFNIIIYQNHIRVASTGSLLIYIFFFFFFSFFFFFFLGGGGCFLSVDTVELQWLESGSIIYPACRHLIIEFSYMGS